MRMPCPTENDYALLLAGELGQADRSALEEHIAGCPQCRALMVELGKAYTPPGERSSLGPSTFLDRPSFRPGASALPASCSEDSRARQALGRLRAAEIAMAAVHVVWAVLILGVVQQASATPETSSHVAEQSAGLAASLDAPLFLSLVYGLVWAPVGALCAAIAAIGVLRRRGWARYAVTLHALLSLPSGVLTLLSVFALRELRRCRALLGSETSKT